MNNTAENNHFPLAILAKAPILNKVKTRLIPELGAHEATAIHEALVRATIEIALQTVPASQITLWTGLEHDHPLFIELSQTFGIALKAQPEGDLGDRMHHAFSEMDQAGLLIGTDCPVLTPDLLSKCYQALSDNDVVLLPAEDGGYGLIGLSIPFNTPNNAANNIVNNPTNNTPQKPLFENIEWGTDNVFKQTQAVIKLLNLSVACPDIIWDVDRPEDVVRWRNELLNK